MRQNNSANVNGGMSTTVKLAQAWSEDFDELPATRTTICSVILSLQMLAVYLIFSMTGGATWTVFSSNLNLFINTFLIN